jgi:hypothetical protein
VGGGRVKMKKFWWVVFILTLVGCSKNPIGPVPPVQHKAVTFEEHISRLQTPSHTYFWVKNFTIYDFGVAGEYNKNWYCWKQKGFPDQTYAVAYEMYDNYVNGENRGQCGQFACTYVMAARTHGYKCGVILTFIPGSGHVQGWIVEKDGTVSITDNEAYKKGVYNSYESFVSAIRSMAKSSIELNEQNKTNANGVWLCNDKCEVMLDQNGEYWDSPKQL